MPDAFLVHQSVAVLEFLERAVATANGRPEPAIVAVYSFLLAFVLPAPSEVVLATPLDLEGGAFAELGIVVLVSGIGKAAGSVIARRVGKGIKRSGPVVRFLERRGFDARARSERQTVRLAERNGYLGLAFALSIPGCPDTLSIYAFSVLEEDYVRFAGATFAGSVGRLLLTVFVGGGTLWAF